jgi:hypothetical protein
MTSEFRVQVQLIDAKWNVKIVEKTFKTEAARDRWLAQREEAGTLHAVLATSDSV